MIMSYDEAKNYKGYARTIDELIKMCEDMMNAMTPEEAEAPGKLSGILPGAPKTNKENFEWYINIIKEKYAEAKKSKFSYRFGISKDRMTEVDVEFDEMKYIYDKLLTNSSYWQPQMRQLFINTYTWMCYRDNPKLREEEIRREKVEKQEIEDIKKYTKPGEPYPGAAELAKRKARANPPKTSLSEAEIKRFDRMSEKWLVRWCNFSHNWAWVVPCLLLCIVANGGLVSAIGLITFMICGEVYSMRVQEYCGVILKWYVDADLVMEKRVINKYFKK